MSMGTVRRSPAGSTHAMRSAPAAPSCRQLAPAAPVARHEFAFVIDPRGRVTSLEAPAALQRLGWLGAGPPLRGHVRPMGMIAAPATGGDVVVTTSAARRPSAAARACDR